MNNSGKMLLRVNGDQLRVAGALDFTVAAAMSPNLHTCIAELPESFQVDLSQLGEFNSAVFVFMLDCLRISALVNKHCRFTGATAGLGNMLKMAGLDELISAA